MCALMEKEKCPVVCEKIGAFKKADKSPTLNENESNVKHDQHATKQMEPESVGNNCDEHYLPNLRPGPDGQVDWTPLGEMTGTKPAVNKYSISRYSLNEWRNHNNEVLDPAIINESNAVDYNAKTRIMQGIGIVDKQQNDNNKRLKQKAKDLFRWKVEVEKACKEISNEVELLELERQRLKLASRELMLPESISKECLELRSNRSIKDLVSDLADQELIKEMNLVKEIRETFKTTLESIEEQMVVNKAAKQKIEYDWCDKQMAYNTETVNLGLNSKSKNILFKPGATRFSDYSAPLEYWEYFCRENIQNCEAARQKSADLRGSLNAILVNGGRKLRTQADKTDVALAECVAITQELCTKLEETLKTTLQRIADMESLIDSLKDSIRKMDVAMKLAQTRLDNRNNWRPHGEAVRDQPHLGLLEEVRKIHETVTSLLGQLRNAERVRSDLLRKRLVLERDIASKRNTLSIDRNRCGMVRSHYPSASQLAGY